MKKHKEAKHEGKQVNCEWYGKGFNGGWDQPEREDL